MNIKVKYNQLIVETEIKAEEFYRAKKFDPKVQAVIEDGKILFSLAAAKTLEPNITSKQFVFNQKLDGKMALVVPLTNSDEVNKSELLEYVENKYGAGLAALAKYEATIIKQVEDTLAPIQDTLDNIEL